MNQNKKRILIFSLTYHPFVGGAEVAIKEITDRIDDIEFDLITLKFDKNLPSFERLGNVNVHRIGFSVVSPEMSDLIRFPLKLNKIFFPVLSCYKAISLHRQRFYDGVWAMMASFAGFGALFFKLVYPKIPFLLTLQEGDPIDYIEQKVRFVYPLFKKIFTKADIIQPISNYLADWAKDMGGKNIKIIPNGVDLGKFNFRFKPIDKNSKIVLIHTGRMVKKNGLEDIIEALKFLPDNVCFLQIGSGPDEVVLKKMVNNFGLEKRVCFKKFAPQAELVNILNEADIFVRPSLSEGFGNSFVEAMAVGLPVIATQEGGIKDFLFDAKRNPEQETTGWAVDLKNSQQTAEAVKNILSDPENTKKIIFAARKMVCEKYDWNIVAFGMRQKIFSCLCEK